MLNSEEFNDRIVGMIVLPYIKGDEVWGVARIYDADTINLLTNKKLSTSPGVSFSPLGNSKKIEIDGTEKILIEDVPEKLDHLALCLEGVWDKLEGPSGVLSTTTGDVKMAEEPKKEDKQDAMPAWAADTFGKMMEHLDSMGKRMDAMEAARSDAVRKDAEEAEAKKKKEEEEAAAAAANSEKDSHKARLDAIEEAVKKAMPAERSDAECAEMADAQARCDSVAHAWGKKASGAMAGETVKAYKARLLRDFQQHSPAWKDVDLGQLPIEALRNAEQAIYADSLTAAKKPDTAAPGVLREVRETSDSGHKITRFYGDPEVFMAPFLPPHIARSKILPINREVR
jgi:hypothetical protein